MTTQKARKMLITSLLYEKETNNHYISMLKLLIYQLIVYQQLQRFLGINAKQAVNYAFSYQFTSDGAYVSYDFRTFACFSYIIILHTNKL